MKYIIKHANGDWTHVQSPLSIEDLTTLIKDNQERYILFNEGDDIIFVGTDYLCSCIIMAAKDSEPIEMDSMSISNYF